MAMIHCRNGPGLGAGGLRKRQGPRSFGYEQKRVYHSPAQTKNEHLITSRLRLRGLVLLFGFRCNDLFWPEYEGGVAPTPKVEARRWGHARVPQATLITTMPGSAKNIYERYWMSKWGRPRPQGIGWRR